MPGNGLNFHPEAKLPAPHLRLAIRRHHIRPWCIRGERENAIGRHHDSAHAAHQTIRAFCQANALCATVRTLDRDGNLYREDEISAAGKIVNSFPLRHSYASGEE